MPLTPEEIRALYEGHSGAVSPLKPKPAPKTTKRATPPMTEKTIGQAAPGTFAEKKPTTLERITAPIKAVGRVVGITQRAEEARRRGESYPRAYGRWLADISGLTRAREWAPEVGWPSAIIQSGAATVAEIAPWIMGAEVLAIPGQMGRMARGMDFAETYKPGYRPSRPDVTPPPVVGPPPKVRPTITPRFTGVPEKPPIKSHAPWPTTPPKATKPTIFPREKVTPEVTPPPPLTEASVRPQIAKVAKPKAPKSLTKAARGPVEPVQPISPPAPTAEAGGEYVPEFPPGKWPAPPKPVITAPAGGEITEHPSFQAIDKLEQPHAGVAEKHLKQLEREDWDVSLTKAARGPVEPVQPISPPAPTAEAGGEYVPEFPPGKWPAPPKPVITAPAGGEITEHPSFQAIDKLEQPHAGVAEKHLKQLEREDWDVSPAREAFEDYKGLERSEFDGAAEFRDARQEAWDNFKDELGNAEPPEILTPKPKAGEAAANPTDKLPVLRNLAKEAPNPKVFVDSLGEKYTKVIQQQTGMEPEEFWRVAKGGKRGTAGKIKPETLIGLGGGVIAAGGAGLQGSEDRRTRLLGQVAMLIGGATIAGAVSPAFRYQLARWGTTGRGMPKGAAAEFEARQLAENALNRQMSDIVGDAVKGLGRTERAELTRLLADPTAIATAPPELAKRAISIREWVDNALEPRLGASVGKYHEELSKAISGNMGEYWPKQYAMYENPKAWKHFLETSPEGQRIRANFVQEHLNEQVAEFYNKRGRAPTATETARFQRNADTAASGLVSEAKASRYGYGGQQLRVRTAKYARRKDMPQWYEDFLGPITADVTPAQRFLRNDIRNIVDMEYFQKLEKMPGAVRDTPGPGYEYLGPKEGTEFVGFKPRKVMSEAQLAGVQATRQYGPLAGKYVAKPIYDTIMEMSTGRSVLAEGLNVANSLAKMGKVILSPPTQVRNCVSNVIAMDVISGSKSIARLPEGIGEMVSRGRWYKEARSGGLFEGTMANVELNDAQVVIGNWARSQALSANPIVRGLAFGAEVAKFPVEKGSKIYQAVEEAFKMADFIAQRQKGLSIEEAVAHARYVMIDYGMQPKWIDTLRRSPFGVPFITYPANMIPRMAGAAVGLKWPGGVVRWDPVMAARFWKYPATVYATQQILAKEHGWSKSKIDKAMENLPEYMRGLPIINRIAPQTLILGPGTRPGAYSTHDIGYLYPWGAAGEAATNIFGVPDVLMPGGIIPKAVAEAGFNRESLTGRTLYDPNTNVLERVARHAPLQTAPTPISSTWRQMGRAKGVGGKTGVWFGVRTRDVEKNARAKEEYWRAQDSLDYWYPQRSYLRAQHERGEVSDSEYAQKSQKYDKTIADLRQRQKKTGYSPGKSTGGPREPRGPRGPRGPER